MHRCGSIPGLNFAEASKPHHLNDVVETETLAGNSSSGCSTVSTMREGGDPEAGAVKVVEALDAYGDYFEHPGWQKLTR